MYDLNEKISLNCSVSIFFRIGPNSFFQYSGALVDNIHLQIDQVI